MMTHNETRNEINKTDWCMTTATRFFVTLSPHLSTWKRYRQLFVFDTINISLPTKEQCIIQPERLP